MHHLRLKMHQKGIWLTHWGAYSAHSNPLVGFRGPLEVEEIGNRQGKDRVEE